MVWPVNFPSGWLGWFETEVVGQVGKAKCPKNNNKKKGLMHFKTMPKRQVIAKFPLVAVLITKSGEVPKDPHTQRQENSKHRAILRAISALVYFARKD